jgi:hypothetical protein
VASGAVTVEGDRAAVKRLRAIFAPERLPARAGG